MRCAAGPTTAAPGSSQKSQSLKLSQQKVVFESEADMTSLLAFHPFESLLVSADDSCGITVWNYEDGGRKVGHFTNVMPGKPTTRITSLGWLNETGSSLLLTGSDDGVIRCVVMTLSQARRGGADSG